MDNQLMTQASIEGIQQNVVVAAKPKPKRRNTEKRKERSRDAARCRRSREAEIFSDMSEMLPLSKDDVNMLDKASVIRIAITYLRIRNVIKWLPERKLNMASNSKDDLDLLLKDINLDAAKKIEERDDVLLEMLNDAIDGFFIILASDGNVLFVTDHIQDFLGIQKLDIMGQSIWDFMHQCDHHELKDVFHNKTAQNEKSSNKDYVERRIIDTHHRDVFIRLKCTLTNRGRNINIKSASYKVIHLTGHVLETSEGHNYMVGICRSIPQPATLEVSPNDSIFLTKHSLDMKFTYVDDKMTRLLGYSIEDLLNTSVFQYHHASDSSQLLITFKSLINKGQAETCRYRFLAKFGGYCWLVTQATIIYEKCKPQGVVCINYVISNLVDDNEIYALKQYNAIGSTKQFLDNKHPPSVCYQQHEHLCRRVNELESKITSTNLKKTAVLSIENTSIIADVVTCQEQKSKKIINEQDPTTSLEQSCPLAVNSAVYNSNSGNIYIDDGKIVRAGEIYSKDNNVDYTHLDKGIEGIEKRKHFAGFVEDSVSVKPQTTITIPSSRNELSDGQTRKEPQHVIPALNTTTLDIATHCDTEGQSISLASALEEVLNIEEEIIGSISPVLENCTGLKARILDERGPKTVTSSILKPNNNVSHCKITSGLLSANTSSGNFPFGTTATGSTNNISAKTVTSKIFQQKSQSTPATILESTQSAQDSLDIFSNSMVNRGFVPFTDYESELTMFKDVAASDVEIGIDDSTVASLFGGMLTSTPLCSNFLADELIMNLDSISNTDGDVKLLNLDSDEGDRHSSLITDLADDVQEITASTFSDGYTINESIIMHQDNNFNENDIDQHIISNNDEKHNHYNKFDAIRINHSTVNDPFICYADESNDTNSSKHLLSPSFTTISSIEGSSLSSLCSPSSINVEQHYQQQLQQQPKDTEFTSAAVNVDDLEDLTMRAPYIPMDEHDDLPLLTSDDQLVWCNSSAFHNDRFNGYPLSKATDMLNELQSSSLCTLMSLPQPLQQQQYDVLSNCTTVSPAKSATFIPSTTTSEYHRLPVDNSQFKKQDFCQKQEKTAKCVRSINNCEPSKLKGKRAQSYLTSPIADEIRIGMPSQSQLNDDVAVKRGEIGANVTPTSSFFDSIDDLLEHCDKKQDEQTTYSWEEFMMKIPLDCVENNIEDSGAGNRDNFDKTSQPMKLSVLKVVDEPTAASSATITEYTQNGKPLNCAQSNNEGQEYNQLSILQIPETQHSNVIGNFGADTNIFDGYPPAKDEEAINVQQQQPSNKRHRNNSMPSPQIEPKRLKSNILPPTIVPISNIESPISNQQIIYKKGTTNVVQKSDYINSNNSNNNSNSNSTPRSSNSMKRNSNGKLSMKRNDDRKQQQSQQQDFPKESNSVLKNLLISGCDPNAGYCIMPSTGAAVCSNLTNYGKA